MWSTKKTTVVWGAVIGFVSGFFCLNIVLAAPSINIFNATQTLIPVGSSTTLIWTVNGATSCVASGDWSGNKLVVGSEGTGALSAGVKTFTLTCTDSVGDSSTSSVNVIVANPPTLTYSASKNSIDYNTATTLSWNSVNANSCEKYGDWSGAIATSGSVSTGNLILEKTFGIRCTGDGGTVEKAVTISILNPELQVTLNFYADDYNLDYNEATNIYWTATNADFCTASGNWNGLVDKDSGSFFTGNLEGSKVFSLFCSNTSGSSELKNVTIIVNPLSETAVTVDAWANSTNIGFNTPATINWTSEEADACRIYDSVWVEGLPVNGTYTSGNLAASKDFTVRCYNASDTADEIITINVVADPDPPPSLNFSASSTGLEYNTSTELNWSVTDADGVAASGDWSGWKDVPTGSESTGNITDNKSYILDAYGSGGTARKIVNVSVGDPIIPPTLSIAADETVVVAGHATVVRWSAENADWCQFFDPYGNSWETSDSYDLFTGAIEENSTYRVDCGNAAGTTSKSVTVEVTADSSPPEIILTADENPVDYGAGTTIRWTVKNAIYCDLWGVGEVSLVDNYNTGSLYGERTYNLTCSGEGGQTEEAITIEVDDIPGNLPEIELYADIYNITTDRSVKLSWWVSNADRCWASRGPWSGDKNPSSGEEDTVILSETTLFEISCENSGGVISDSLTIFYGNIDGVDLEFYADNTNIEKNSYVNLTWNAKNAEYCKSYSYDDEDNIITNWDRYQNQVVGVESTVTVGPISQYETHLLLKCWNFTSNTGWVDITILAGNPPPSVVMSAPGIVAYNTPVVISWYAENAVSCQKHTWQERYEDYWNGDVGTSGMQVIPNITEVGYFNLSCFNADGEGGSDYVMIDVGPTNGISPEVSFTSDKYIATEGEEFTLSWDVKNADYCRATSNPYDALWDGNISSVTGSQTLTFSGERREFILTCGNSDGSVSAFVRIGDSGSEFGIPSVSLWVDDISLPVNGQTTLHWYTENAESCVASNGWSGVKASGAGQEQTGPLLAGTRFELSCTNGAGTRTVFADVSVGGPPPSVQLDFTANAYDISAGRGVTLSWAASNASYCYALDPTNNVFVGSKATTGSDSVYPPISTTYKIVCGNAGGEQTRIVSITVAKVIVCPNPARIIDVNGTLQLTAWFKADADAAFSCSDVSGATDITNGTLGFTTTWTSANSSLVDISSNGLATGLDFTDSNGGPVLVSAEYKNTTGVSRVTVSPPPVSCWECTEAKTCSSEITFPEDGKCSDETFDSMYECSKSCRNPVDWQEVGS